MNKAEFTKKIREIDAAFELKRYEYERAKEYQRATEDAQSTDNRARSITVGTAFGGTTEIMMRSDAGRHIWCIMQPVEVIELIHQLAANVGCHIHIKPRQDFGSWRDWKVTEEERLHYNGHAPHVNDMAPHHEVGANMNTFLLEQELAKQEEKAKAKNNVSKKNNKLANKIIEKDNRDYMFGGAGGDGFAAVQAEILKKQLEELAAKEMKNGEDTVATEKVVNKRTTKRTARAS